MKDRLKRIAAYALSGLVIGGVFIAGYQSRRHPEFLESILDFIFCSAIPCALCIAIGIGFFLFIAQILAKWFGVKDK